MQKYTLDQIIMLLDQNKVNIQNIKVIVHSLNDFKLNDQKVMYIYKRLSKVPELPENIRNLFKEEIEKYVQKVETAEKDEKAIVAETPPPAKFVEEQIENKRSISNEELLKSIYRVAAANGLRVSVEKKSNTLSFELDEVSKPYIDNMLQKLYKSDNYMNVGLQRIEQTKKELLVLQLNNKNLTPKQIEEKVTDMLYSVDTILKQTDKTKDYESKMNLELRGMKDKFFNDDPNIPDQDFKIGYSNDQGGKSFYVIADSEEKAVEVSELMGYEIKKDRGGNVYEVNTDKPIEGSKLEKNSQNVNDIDDIKTTGIDVYTDKKGAGMTDVYVDYNARHFGDEDEFHRVIQFIDKNKNNISTLRIDTTVNNQRIIRCTNEEGLQEEIVIQNGDNFDRYYMPEITKKISQLRGNKTAETTTNPDSTVNYDIDTQNLDVDMNNFDQHVIDQMGNELYEHQRSLESKPKVKTLGTMPTRQQVYNESAKISIMALMTIILAMLLGVCIFFTIYFAI